MNDFVTFIALIHFSLSFLCKLSIRLILRAADLKTFRSKTDAANSSRQINKLFWIDLIRSRSTTRTDYFVAFDHETVPKGQPFKPFSITFNTDENIDPLVSHDGLITRNYLPARLTSADLSAIDKFKSASWKLIQVRNGVQLQALRVYVYGKPKFDLTLPTVSTYKKTAHRDLDSGHTSKNPESDNPANKRNRMTPAQLFDTIQVNNSENPNEQSLPDECHVPATISIRNSAETNTIPTPRAITAPPTNLEDQINSSLSSIQVRKQRDFPLIHGWLDRKEFKHIMSQLISSYPNPYPNIYLRMKIRTNHVYYVYIQDVTILSKLPCVTIIYGDRMLHFAPIHGASERKHRPLYKQFTGANTEKKGFGSWITLPNLQDLAFLSQTVPMRDHFDLIHYLKNNDK